MDLDPDPGRVQQFLRIRIQSIRIHITAVNSIKNRINCSIKEKRIEPCESGDSDCALKVAHVAPRGTARKCRLIWPGLKIACTDMSYVRLYHNCSDLCTTANWQYFWILCRFFGKYFWILCRFFGIYFRILCRFFGIYFEYMPISLIKILN